MKPTDDREEISRCAKHTEWKPFNPGKTDVEEHQFINPVRMKGCC